MAIASTDRNDAMSSFSQWGLTSVDMGAPGSAILSTTPGNTYSTFSGTSMATPHVAGAAALVWSINPDLSATAMKQLLMDSGDVNADLTGKTVAGTRLNVANALDLADPDPGYRFSVTPASQTIEAGSSTSYDYSVGSVAGWDGTVALSVAVSPALAGVTLSSNSVMADDTFMVNVATDASTPWGDYTITVTGDDGSTVKEKSVSLTVLPEGLQDFTYSNTDSAAIPDNDPAGIVSTIVVADDVQVFGVDANVDISHTWIGDLVVTLTSPAGTEVVLHNREGGSADDIVKNWDLSAFNGEIATGTWSLFVNDNVGADTGTLNSWGIVISGVGEAAPAAPIAGFSYAVDGLNVAFTNSSSDVNDDIVSYSWDLGDGNVSTDMSPAHTYATAGTYTVSMMVTDAEGNSDSAMMDVEVFEHTITAGVVRAKLSRRGSALVDLTWDGAAGDDVVVYRDGVAVATTSNDGRYRDRFSGASSSVEYKICEASSSLCSDPMTVNF